MVRAKGVSRGYLEGQGIRSVLKGLDLEVFKGRKVALIGRSGSGKSTLLNLLSGIDSPDEGLIEIDGVELSRLGERERTLFRRRHIGFVYQFFNLIPTLTVEENVALPLELNGYEREQNRVGSMLEDVELGSRAGAFPEELSGGEQQRVALARALIHRPKLILADEPTGNLDAETGKRIIDLLGRLVVLYGSTLIVVTHSPDVSEVCDEVYRLESGRLVEIPNT